MRASGTHKNRQREIKEKHKKLDIYIAHMVYRMSIYKVCVYLKWYMVYIIWYMVYLD